MKGNEWFSLFSFFFLYNHNVHWGFSDYIMSIPIFLFYLLVLIKYFETNKIIFAVSMGLMLILLFFSHFQTAIFGLVTVFTFVIFKKVKDYRFILKTLFFLMPVVILMIFAYKSNSNNTDPGLFSFLINYYSKDYFIQFPERIKNFFVIDNFYFFIKSPGAIFAFIISLIILVPLIIQSGYIKTQIIKVLRQIRTIQPIKDIREENSNYLMQSYLFPLLFISFICYLFLPDNIPGQCIIYERFTVFIYLFLIVLIGIIYKSKIFNLSGLMIIAIPLLAYFTVVSFYFYDFQDATKNFTKEIFPDSSENKVLAGIILDNEFRGRPLYIHFPMYNTVWKNGITTGLVDYRYGFIKRKADKNILPGYNEFLYEDYKYHNEYDNVDYILVHDKDDIKIKDFKVLKKSDDWRLLNVK